MLQPGHPENFYDLFAICPNEALRQRLNQVELRIDNWHNLMPRRERERSVVKKGTESDEAFARRMHLGALHGHPPGAASGGRRLCQERSPRLSDLLSLAR